MSNSSDKLLSDNPNAPQLPHPLYFEEKVNFAGVRIGGILYGVVIVLFFQCMTVFLSSAYRTRKGVRWGLIAYTVISFSIVTTYTAINLYSQSISYVDNRDFSGSIVLPPGPIGYGVLSYSKPISVVANLMFLLNNWLADGLLIYRCYVFYNKKFWVVAFPCLAYLGSIPMGIMLLYQASQPNNSIWSDIAINFGVPYFSISLGLNILLTLLIVARLAMHSRNIRMAMGHRAGASGLYKTIITVLVECCAIYALTSLLFVVPWSLKSNIGNIFLPILAEIQVIAPLLIIRRVANQSALTTDTVSGNPRSREHFGTIGGNGNFPDRHSTDSNPLGSTYGKTSEDKIGAEADMTSDVVLNHSKG